MKGDGGVVVGDNAVVETGIVAMKGVVDES